MAVVAIVAVGRNDAAIIKVEPVSDVSTRVGSGGPVVAVLASGPQPLIAGIDIPAPHKE